MKLDIRRILFVFIVLQLTACAGNSTHAPVVERRAPINKVPATYTVIRGDTLYSIAWQYGLDHKGLASANGIRSPYLIQPGQRLTLKLGSSPRSVSSSAGRKQQKSSATTSSVATESRSKNKVTGSTSQKSRYSLSTKWHWPATGKLLKGYSAKGKVNKGIDIGGKLGDAVKSTQAGTVVYAGDRLAGYGKLVIIKHNALYLSAYAHNSRILVSEGQNVKAGMKIAEMGRSGGDPPMLHFEIRREGKPVNPLALLPKR